MTKLEKAMIDVLVNVKEGQIMTYKEVAIFAGYDNCARQVARVLRKYSKEYHLPWHRILGAGYKIRIHDPEGFQTQKELLIREGYSVTQGGSVSK